MPRVFTVETVWIVRLNAAYVVVGEKAMDHKKYYHHSGYPGGIRSVTADKVLSGPHADRVVRSAVRGMLPHNSLGRQMLGKLKVYTGPNHPHAAQQPQELTLG